MNGNKKYEASFKLEVARMVVDQGMGVAKIVKDMGIGESAVRRWVPLFSTETMCLFASRLASASVA
jgi:transposase